MCILNINMAAIIPNEEILDDLIRGERTIKTKFDTLVDCQSSRILKETITEESIKNGRMAYRAACIMSLMLALYVNSININTSHHGRSPPNFFDRALIDHIINWMLEDDLTRVQEGSLLHKTLQLLEDEDLKFPKDRRPTPAQVGRWPMDGPVGSTAWLRGYLR